MGWLENYLNKHPSISKLLTLLKKYFAVSVVLAEGNIENRPQKLSAKVEEGKCRTVEVKSYNQLKIRIQKKYFSISRYFSRFIQ